MSLAPNMQALLDEACDPVPRLLDEAIGLARRAASVDDRLDLVAVLQELRRELESRPAHDPPGNG